MDQIACRRHSFHTTFLVRVNFAFGLADHCNRPPRPNWVVIPSGFLFLPCLIAIHSNVRRNRRGFIAFPELARKTRIQRRQQSLPRRDPHVAAQMSSHFRAPAVRISFLICSLCVKYVLSRAFMRIPAWMRQHEAPPSLVSFVVSALHNVCTCMICWRSSWLEDGGSKNGSRESKATISHVLFSGASGSLLSCRAFRLLEPWN